MFCEARKRVDCVGKVEEHRPVERAIFPKPEPKQKHTGSAVFPLVVKDATAQHWQDVRELASVLNPDGGYFVNGEISHSPVVIADELLQSGITWVTRKKVKQAQRRLAKRQKAVAR